MTLVVMLVKETLLAIHQGATSPQVQIVLYAQTTPVSHPAPTAQLQNKVFSQLLPTLIVIHEALDRLAGNQTELSSLHTSPTSF